MKFAWLLMFGLALGLGCSDDESAGTTGDRPICEFGERYSPITGTCMPISTPQNNAQGGGDPNNDENNQNNPDPNNVSNNQTTNPNNPSETNNQTSPNNNQPDMGDDMDIPDMPPLECGTGGVIGLACTPSGDVLAAADVTITGTDCATGQPFEMVVRTSADGTYEFADVPSGAHNLNISTGSFSGDSGVFVRAGEVTDLSSAVDKVCLDGTAVNIAVVGGAYDAVEDLVTGLNLTYDQKGDDNANLTAARTFLSNPNEMANYDIIFLNCGELYGRLGPLFPFQQDPRPQIVNNLRNFVNNGGSIYASDWAFPWVEMAFGDVLDMLGVEGDGNGSKMGFAPQTVTADVLTTDLQTILGRNTATIAFPHNPPAVVNTNWVVLEGVGPQTVNQIRADVQLCSTPSNCSTAGATQSAAPLLVTWKAPSGGTVVFTSFHNKRQATLNQDMELILRYLIFQL